MAVWTIAAQEGTGGERIAAELAASAGVPLLDRHTLARFAHELNPDELDVEDLEAIEERFGGRLRMLALSMAIMTGPAAAAWHEALRGRRPARCPLRGVHSPDAHERHRPARRPAHTQGRPQLSG